MAALGVALADRLGPLRPDIVLTAEASGIAPALVTAAALGIPMIYAKKYSPTVETPALARVIPSPTKGGEVMLSVAARYLSAGMAVAIVDDFWPMGALPWPWPRSWPMPRPGWLAQALWSRKFSRMAAQRLRLAASRSPLSPAWPALGE